MNIKRSNIEFYADDFKVVGIVSNSKEYKIAWILNNLLNINFAKGLILSLIRHFFEDIYYLMTVILKIYIIYILFIEYLIILIFLY